MTRFACLTAAFLTVSPAVASAEEGDVGQGLDLLSQGTQMLLRGLIEEIEPTLRDIQPRLQELQPFLRELESVLPNLNLYHLPEILPNGDIIIRRKNAEDGAGSEEIEL